MQTAIFRPNTIRVILFHSSVVGFVGLDVCVWTGMHVSLSCLLRIRYVYFCIFGVCLLLAKLMGQPAQKS